jgi:ribosomal protein L31E
MKLERCGEWVRWKKGAKRVIKLEKEFSLRHQEHHEIIVPPGT